MPIYEYECRACGFEFEREQRISEDPIKTCPKCKARRARRLISRTSFVLKGGGWYSDLYSTPGAKPSSGDAGAEKSDSKSGGDDAGKKSSDKAPSDKVSLPEVLEEQAERGVRATLGA
jgi:putative FmdB family regulatory protein